MTATSSHECRWFLHLSAAVALATGLGLVAPAALAASHSSLPALQHEGKVAFMSGGIGDREAQAMKQAAAEYPLEVEFLKKEANGRAAYLAADEVTIRDHAGKTVLQTTSEGPFLLAKLPPGHYLVTAVNQKVSKQREIDIAKDAHRDVVFEW